MKKLAIVLLTGAFLFAFSTVTHAVSKEKYSYEKVEKQVSLPEFAILNHFVFAVDREQKTSPANYSVGYTIVKPILQLTAILPGRICMLQVQRYQTPVNDGKYDNRQHSYSQYWRNINSAETRV